MESGVPGKSGAKGAVDKPGCVGGSEAISAGEMPIVSMDVQDVSGR